MQLQLTQPINGCDAQTPAAKAAVPGRGALSRANRLDPAHYEDALLIASWFAGPSLLADRAPVRPYDAER